MSTNLSLQTFVDIGAGIGLFSLMAASRGHPVIAFEMGKNSIESFNASLVYNGFQDRVQIHQVRPLYAPQFCKWMAVEWQNFLQASMDSLCLCIRSLAALPAGSLGARPLASIALLLT